MLRAIPAIEPKNVIIGQYTRSSDGSKPGYKEDDTVPKESRCPTFCSLVVYLKNERWDGVPFILKAGKGEWALRRGREPPRLEGLEAKIALQRSTNRRPRSGSSSRTSRQASSRTYPATSS